jgi:hypothetical protein
MKLDNATVRESKSEPVDLHRRGHWFKSSIAHHFNSVTADHESATSHNKFSNNFFDTYQVDDL